MQKGIISIFLGIFFLFSFPISAYSDEDMNYSDDEYDQIANENTYSVDELPIEEAEGYYSSDDSYYDKYQNEASQSVGSGRERRVHQRYQQSARYDARFPKNIVPPGERIIIVDPRLHAWGAYGPDGVLLREGLATAGGNWCSDIERPCRTTVGIFRIQSLGDRDCKSSIYPIEEGGGAPMPYCMYFNGGQGIHASNGVYDGNGSHGCVRVRINDAEWIRFNFATIGTKVIIRPY